MLGAQASCQHASDLSGDLGLKGRPEQVSERKRAEWAAEGLNMLPSVSDHCLPVTACHRAPTITVGAKLAKRHPLGVGQVMRVKGVLEEPSREHNPQAGTWAWGSKEGGMSVEAEGCQARAVDCCSSSCSQHLAALSPSLP